MRPSCFKSGFYVLADTDGDGEAEIIRTLVSAEIVQVQDALTAAAGAVTDKGEVDPWFVHGLKVSWEGTSRSTLLVAHSPGKSIVGCRVCVWVCVCVCVCVWRGGVHQ
jgi:hypothetical protein